MEDSRLASTTALLRSLLVLSVAINVGLAVRLNRAPLSSQRRALPTGGTAPSLLLRGVSSPDEVLDFRSGAMPILLYWFAPHCGWCQQNLPNLRALAAQSAGHYRLVPVSSVPVTDLVEYAQKNDFGVPVYRISQAAARDYGLEGTPDTILLSPRGALVGRWAGAYSPRLLTEIEGALKVNLPGWANK